MINYKIRVRNLIRKYNTCNPYKLATLLNIEVLVMNLSLDMPKGIFKKVLGTKFIIINSSRVLNEADKDFILAHELGHAIFHSSDRAFFLHDHTFYQRGRFEIEANKFAAELLIDEKEIDEITLNEMTITQISSYFNVPKELVEYKFNKFF